MGSLAKSNPNRGPNRAGSQCGIHRLLGELDSDDRAAVLEWVNDFGYTAKAISRELADNQIEISVGQIQRHRRKDCVCRLDRPELYD